MTLLEIVVSASKKADPQRVDMLSSFGRIFHILQTPWKDGATAGKTALNLYEPDNQPGLSGAFDDLSGLPGTYDNIPRLKGDCWKDSGGLQFTGYKTRLLIKLVLIALSPGAISTVGGVFYPY